MIQENWHDVLSWNALWRVPSHLSLHMSSVHEKGLLQKVLLV